MTRNKMAGAGGSINIRQEERKTLAINVKEGWRECRRDRRIVVRQPIRSENIPGEEEEEGGGGGEGGVCSLSYGFLWHDTDKPNRRGILVYHILLDISSSTSVPSICYPLNLLCMP